MRGLGQTGPEGPGSMESARLGPQTPLGVPKESTTMPDPAWMGFRVWSLGFTVLGFGVLGVGGLGFGGLGFGVFGFGGFGVLGF